MIILVQPGKMFVVSLPSLKQHGFEMKVVLIKERKSKLLSAVLMMCVSVIFIYFFGFFLP